jgi:hypothetical protein
VFERQLAIGIKSPLAGVSLAHLDLVPNDGLREEIKRFRSFQLGKGAGGGGFDDQPSLDLLAQVLVEHGFTIAQFAGFWVM